MKIWCEKCNGTGKEIVSYGKPSIFEINHAYKFKCKECNGKGYNEIDFDLQEVGRNGRIALAIKNLIESKNGIQYAERINNSLLHYKFYDINTIEELLEWGDEYYEGM